MIPLNLPSFDIKLQGTREHPRVLDVLRRRYVALTPEEWVRQSFIHYLIEHLGYPQTLLARGAFAGGRQATSRRQRAIRPSPSAQDDHRIQGPNDSHYTTSFRANRSLQHSASRGLSHRFKRLEPLLLQSEL